MMPASLQNMPEPYHVALDIDRRILNRIAYACLRGKIHHDIRSPFRKQLIDTGSIRYIYLVKMEIRLLHQFRQTRLLERNIVVAVQIIQTDHFISALKQTSSKVKT